LWKSLITSVASGDPKAVIKELIGTVLVEEEILSEREADEISTTDNGESPIDVLLRKVELKAIMDQQK
jgi:uncharacterized circularly permuted ATP-grasp superfamily protein